MTNTQPSKTKKPSRLGMAFQLVMLLFLLIGAPYLSWHYLSKGVEYRVSRINQMGEYGDWSDLTLSTHEGSNLQIGKLKDSVVIMTFPGIDNGDFKDFPLLDKMKDQFNDRSDVKFFWVLDIGDSTLGSSLLTAKPDKYADVYFIDESDPAYLAFINQLPSKKPLGGTNTLVVIDKKSMVRNVYDPFSEEDMGRMVEHITILLPPKKVDKPELNRQKEK